MHPDSEPRKQRKSNQHYIELWASMQATERAIKTQVPCRFSFKELMVELSK